MKAGDFENMPEHVIANIAYMSENLGDCWVYPDAPPMENGKPDARAYMGVMNLLQNVLNLALQSRKRLDEYREVYGELPSWGFYVRHVDGIRFEDVRLRLTEDDMRPAFVFDDVKNAKLVDVQTPEADHDQIFWH